MIDINQLEKEKLYQWACENSTKEIEEKYFTNIDKNCKSYYENTYQGEYCREYAFQTPKELHDVLSGLWKDDVMKEIMRVVIVASMKNKPLIRFEKSTVVNREKEQVKPFIYEF